MTLILVYCVRHILVAPSFILTSCLHSGPLEITQSCGGGPSVSLSLLLTRRTSWMAMLDPPVLPPRLGARPSRTSQRSWSHLRSSGRQTALLCRGFGPLSWLTCACAQRWLSVRSLVIERISTEVCPSSSNAAAWTQLLHQVPFVNAASGSGCHT